MGPRHDRLQRGLEIGHGGEEPLPQLPSSLVGRHSEKPPGTMRRRMRGAAADERAPLVRQPLQPERSCHHLAVGRHEREDRRRTQQVRRHQEVDVKDVRVEVLGVLEELRSFQVCSLTSIPSASSVALTDASEWPMEQMPQMRLVMRATSE